MEDKLLQYKRILDIEVYALAPKGKLVSGWLIRQQERDLSWRYHNYQIGWIWEDFFDFEVSEQEKGEFEGV